MCTGPGTSKWAMASGKDPAVAHMQTLPHSPADQVAETWAQLSPPERIQGLPSSPGPDDRLCQPVSQPLWGIHVNGRAGKLPTLPAQTCQTVLPQGGA